MGSDRRFRGSAERGPSSASPWMDDEVTVTAFTRPSGVRHRGVRVHVHPDDANAHTSSVRGGVRPDATRCRSPAAHGRSPCRTTSGVTTPVGLSQAILREAGLRQGEYMREQTYKVRIHREGHGSMWAEVVELPGCVATGDTELELGESLAEAFGLYLSTDDERVHAQIMDTSPSAVEVHEQRWLVGASHDPPARQRGSGCADGEVPRRPDDPPASR